MGDSPVGLSVIEQIAHERARQVAIEHWTPEHDDGWVQGELGLAAACYASPVYLYRETKAPTLMGYQAETAFKGLWPWSKRWWKPKTRRRDLIRAAALIVAEIERLDRLSPPTQEGKA